MRRKFRIDIARNIYNTIMSYGTVSPVQLNNACELVGIGQSPKRKNYLMMYFMVKEPYDKYERDIEPTELELKQISYISRNMHLPLWEFIKDMDKPIQVSDNRTFDKTQLLDVLFSAADTSEEQSHDEDHAVYNSQEELEADKASTTATFEYSKVRLPKNGEQDSQVVTEPTKQDLVSKPKRKRSNGRKKS